MIVPPNTFRIFGSPNDVPEAYIPLAPGTRSRAILQRMVDGPTEEERVARTEAAIERDRERAVQRRLKTVRHMALLGMHEGLLKQLLEEHAPHEREFGGEVLQECHGCPAYQDDHPYHGVSEFHHEWPCPTWQTISDATP